MVHTVTIPMSTIIFVYWPYSMKHIIWPIPYDAQHANITVLCQFLAIGITYIVASLVVLILIRERNDPDLANSCLNVKDSYIKLFKLLTLRAIQIWPSLKICEISEISKIF